MHGFTDTGNKRHMARQQGSDKQYKQKGINDEWRYKQRIGWPEGTCHINQQGKQGQRCNAKICLDEYVFFQSENDERQVDRQHRQHDHKTDHRFLQ